MALETILFEGTRIMRIDDEYRKEYGRMMAMDAIVEYADIVRKLKDSASVALKPGTRYELRMADIDSTSDFDRRNLPENYRPRWGLCWYSFPAGFACLPGWKEYEATSFEDALLHWVPELGCYRIARLISLGERENHAMLFALDGTGHIPAIEGKEQDG